MKLFYDPRPFSGQSKQRAMEDLARDTVPDRDFYLLVAGAVLLAAAGILLDSIPVLIASMIVAPLAQPLLLLSLGAVVRDRRFAARAAGMLAGAAVSALVIAFVVSWAAGQWLGIGPDRAMISFSPNYFFDIGIALVSGFVAAYGLMRPKVGGAMTGIGIAVSLMPPLVATGMEIAVSNMGLAADAFVIVILNVAGILLASGVCFAVFGFRREYQKIKK